MSREGVVYLSKCKDSYDPITTLCMEDIETVFYKDGDGEEKHEMVKKEELEEVEAKKETQTEPSMEAPFAKLTLGEDDVFEVR